ncbi:MAG: hypothetical protein IKA68_01375 [Clostridia bacterium]|nr:hypothetical protein [Clostridia bacterium]MBR2613575.1 hypothetical protein [Clostridia bacterium]
MGKFKNKLYRFMYGRYGTDTLSTVLLYVYFAFVLICTVVSIFVRSLWFSIFYYVVATALVVWMLSRMFSRNIAARKRENDKFCGFFKLRKNKFRDRKTHVYRKCPSCKAVLRLPKAKGKHFVVCPRCKNRFEVKG